MSAVAITITLAGLADKVGTKFSSTLKLNMLGVYSRVENAVRYEVKSR